MLAYKCRMHPLPGSSAEELTRLARKHYHQIQKRTPRRTPYVRAKYFQADKIFINNYWDHLKQKSRKERVARLRLYPCALEVLQQSTFPPVVTRLSISPHKSYFRFLGKTNTSNFYVQVQVNNKSGRKDLMSAFPIARTK